MHYITEDKTFIMTKKDLKKYKKGDLIKLILSMYSHLIYIQKEAKTLRHNNFVVAIKETRT